MRYDHVAQDLLRSKQTEAQRQEIHERWQALRESEARFNRRMKLLVYGLMGAAAGTLAHFTYTALKWAWGNML